MSAEGQWLPNHASGMYTPDFSPDARHPDSRAASTTTRWVMQQSTDDFPMPIAQSLGTDTAYDEELHDEDNLLEKHIRFLEDRVTIYRKGHNTNLKHMKYWQGQMTIDLQGLQSIKDQLLIDIRSVKSSQEHLFAKTRWLESQLGKVPADSQAAMSQENVAETKASTLAHGHTSSDVESLRSVVDQMTSSIETLTCQYNQMAERINTLGASVGKHAKEIDSLQTWSDQTVEVLNRSLSAIRELSSRVYGRTKDDD